MSRTITVVIPAHNAGRYLARVLASVHAQTRRPDQVIVIDDGSTDDTAAIADADPDVALIRQANAGASVARNAGIQAARGEWIAFLDADDEWLPEHLALHDALLDRNPHLVWTTGNSFWCRCDRGHLRRQDVAGERLRRVQSLLAGKDYFDSYFTAYAHFAAGNTDTMVVRKDVLIEAGLFHAGRPRMNDIDMWFRIAYRHQPIGFVGSPTAIYHVDVPDSTVKRHAEPQALFDFMDRHLELARQHGRLDEFTPCAVKIIGWWMKCSLQKRQGREVRLILRRYGHLFPLYTRLTTSLHARLPVLGNVYESFKHRLRGDTE